MNQYKKRLNQLLELTLSEKRGMLVFLALIVIIIYSPEVYHRFFEKEVQFEKLERRVLEIRKESRVTPIPEKKIISLEPFDPNTCSEGELINLGFSRVIAKRIIKYRNAGGEFRKVNDLEKIYGLDKEHFNRIKEYITIAAVARSLEYKSPVNTSIKREKLLVNLNSADSIEFLALKGIGPVYASRIIKYRNLLGGYVIKEQLKEVYGISDSLYYLLQDQIFLDSISEIQTIPINKVSKEELRQHPYFRSYAMCKAIVNYRIQHGQYESRIDLNKVHLVSDSVLNKISPYISY